MPTPPLTDAQRAFFEKLRKGAFGSLSVKKFGEICQLLDGWSITSAVGYLGTMDLDPFAKPVLGQAYTSIKPDVADPRDPDHPNQMSAEGVAALRAGHVRLQGYEESVRATHAWLETLRVTALPDATPKTAPPLVVPALSPIRAFTAAEEDDDQNHGTHECTAHLLVRTPYHRITAPNGQTFDLVLDTKAVGYRNGQRFDAFLTWAKAHTDFLDQVNAALGTAPHVPKSQQPRTDVHVGMCGVCGGDFKCKPEDGDHLVKHGYQRPGIGYLIGECFGVGYQPYELSADACRAFDAYLAKTERAAQAQLALLRSGAVSELPNPEYSRWTAAREPAVVEPGHVRWPEAMRFAIAQQEMMLRHLASDREVMAARIAAWAPHPELIRREDQAPTPRRSRRR